jgi:hypothetical protein
LIANVKAEALVISDSTANSLEVLQTKLELIFDSVQGDGQSGRRSFPDGHQTAAVQKLRQDGSYGEDKRSVRRGMGEIANRSETS